LRPAAIAVIVAGAFVAGGCTSPEATRTRGGGPGGDVGNRGPTVEMHEGSRPFFKTPGRIGALDHPSLDSAQQAYDVSRQ